MTRILIVEDENEIAELEKDYLDINGFETDIVNDGRKAVEAIVSGNYELVLLDVMLPGLNGYEIVRAVRDKVSIPILMVTARGESVDKIRGLGLGADDYISKPFDPAELVARVKAHIAQYERLSEIGKPVSSDEEELQIGNLRIMTRNYMAYKGDEEIRFPNKEFELLLFLARNPNIVFSKEDLFEKIWGFDYMGDSATVTVHVNRIREKIEDNPQEPKILETVWGAGYRINR